MWLGRTTLKPRRSTVAISETPSLSAAATTEASSGAWPSEPRAVRGLVAPRPREPGRATIELPAVVVRQLGLGAPLRA